MGRNFADAESLRLGVGSWVPVQAQVIGTPQRGHSMRACFPSSALGIQHAADVLSAEPFDEMACQALMRAHAKAGNRAEALRVYANCRKLFRDELGAEPSEQTAAVFLSILRAE